jgi:hypothetical protein
VRNAPASWSVVAGLLGAAALPVAVVVTDRRADVELLWAAVAVPVAVVLGVTALALARRGRRKAELSVLRESGGLAWRIGRVLGILALLLAGSGVTALLVYALLSYRGRG